MALDATNRFRTFAQFMRDQTSFITGLTKPDLTAAIAATDDWCDANQTSFNNALPAAAKAMPLAFKSLLLAYVVMRRAGVLHAREDG